MRAEARKIIATGSSPVCLLQLFLSHRTTLSKTVNTFKAATTWDQLPTGKKICLPKPFWIKTTFLTMINCLLHVLDCYGKVVLSKIF